MKRDMRIRLRRDVSPDRDREARRSFLRQSSLSIGSLALAAILVHSRYQRRFREPGIDEGSLIGDARYLVNNAGPICEKGSSLGIPYRGAKGYGRIVTNV